MDDFENEPDASPATAAHASQGSAASDSGETKHLSPAARRALAEAEERRAARDRAREQPTEPSQKEVGGRQGPDPIRFGDWEKGGICSDF